MMSNRGFDYRFRVFVGCEGSRFLIAMGDGAVLPVALQVSRCAQIATLPMRLR